MTENNYIDKIDKTFKEEENRGKKTYMRQALNILSRRDHSIKEFEQKLLKKGIPEEDVQKLCAEFIEKDYLNDERYARRIAELYYKKFGVKRVENELFKKGLDNELIKEITEEFYDKEQAVDNIYSQIEKIINAPAFQRRLNSEDYDEEKEYRRLFGKFQRAGYTFSEIKQALEMFEEFNQDIYIDNDE